MQVTLDVVITFGLSLLCLLLALPVPAYSSGCSFYDRSSSNAIHLLKYTILFTHVEAKKT